MFPRFFLRGFLIPFLSTLLHEKRECKCHAGLFFPIFSRLESKSTRMTGAWQAKGEQPQRTGCLTSKTMSSTWRQQDQLFAHSSSFVQGGAQAGLLMKCSSPISDSRGRLLLPCLNPSGIWVQGHSIIAAPGSCFYWGCLQFNRNSMNEWWMLWCTW